MFFLRFLISSMFPKTYQNGILPHYSTIKPGKVIKIVCGGEFKYTDKLLCTKVGWAKIDSDEKKILESPAYRERQAEIRKELQQVKTMNISTSDNT